MIEFFCHVYWRDVCTREVVTHFSTVNYCADQQFRTLQKEMLVDICWKFGKTWWSISVKSERGYISQYVLFLWYLLIWIQNPSPLRHAFSIWGQDKCNFSFIFNLYPIIQPPFPNQPPRWSYTQLKFFFCQAPTGV